MIEHDWLEGDIEQQRRDMRIQEIEFAKLYEIFVDSPRGQELLTHWEVTILDVGTPTESSIQRYAKDEGVREFIRGIRNQIKLAQERI